MDEETLAALCRPHVLSHHMGRVVGRHRGAHYYTIGQRKGLNVGGKTEPLFIIGTDVAANVVYTGMGDSHPGLYRYGLSMQPHEVHWLRPSQALTPGAHRRYMGRIRYRQPLEPCTLYRTESTYHLVFDTAQRGIAPGQFAAWYDGEELAGSGVIG
jgi:tRNA-specific 2-thiouridylase